MLASCTLKMRNKINVEKRSVKKLSQKTTPILINLSLVIAVLKAATQTSAKP